MSNIQPIEIVFTIRVPKMPRVILEAGESHHNELLCISSFCKIHDIIMQVRHNSNTLQVHYTACL